MTTPLNILTESKVLRFGVFELDLENERLLKNGRTVRLQPQPFKLLCLLATQSGRLVTRDEIRQTLWEQDTFVDFEQGVNFAIKQVREALGEDAENPLFVQTVPKRGYKFVAPVEVVAPRGNPVLQNPARTDGALSKLLWTHIADMRLAEVRRRKRRKALTIGVIGAAVVGLIVFALMRW